MGLNPKGGSGEDKENGRGWVHGHDVLHTSLEEFDVGRPSYQDQSPSAYGYDRSDRGHSRYPTRNSLVGGLGFRGSFHNYRVVRQRHPLNINRSQDHLRSRRM